MPGILGRGALALGRAALALGRGALPILLVAGPAAALAQAPTGLGRVTSFHARFTTKHTGAATGLTLKTTGRPPKAGVTEAPAVRQTLILPPGTVLRLRSLPQCSASDALIASNGAEGACPAKSRVGTGGADGLLNGTPVHFDIGIYAVRGHLVFAAEQAGKPLKRSFEGFSHGRRLILTVPTLGGSIAPTSFDAAIPARPGAKTWLRTPSTCPSSHRWTSVGWFQGVSAATGKAQSVTGRQTVRDHLRCG